MNLILIRLTHHSSEQDIAAWERIRILGRNYYIRTGVLLWFSCSAGIIPFLDLLYHFAQNSVWKLSIWSLVLPLFVAVAALFYFSRSWQDNERKYRETRA